MAAIGNAVNNEVNNEIYDQLGQRWYEAQDDPIALLRAEAALRNPWIIEVLRSRGAGPLRVLDIGCGGGFLSNALAEAGMEVDAVDLSESSLAVARERDKTRSVRYQRADAYALPFEAGEFDAVCAMDFLEHVQNPEAVIAQAARVLKPGGAFFFHTFNRNPLSWLFAVKGVECFVRNTPPRLHVYTLLIRPSELTRMARSQGLAVEVLRGCQPCLGTRAFWRLLRTGVVPRDFRFRWSRNLWVGYVGYAVKGEAL